jgi:hypothetical protein
MCHHEIAVFAFDRTQQLEAEETGRILDRMGAMRESLLQFRASVGGHLDCVDFHDWHVVRLPRPFQAPDKAALGPGKMNECPQTC